ncbi:hypothetical protein N7G274_005942 [Stereocaulon virgatum]|uniref:Uncharacterized protein n=1 Tax=Stereocaulon virgatum TaxID=373712 RepID=A0ABR4A7V0_9LECA
MSPSPSQEQLDASKPNGSDQDNADNERIPPQTPTSAQPAHETETQPASDTHDPSSHSSPQHRSSSVQPPSSKTDLSSHITNNNALPSNTQTGQNDQHLPPQEQDLGGAKDALEAYDWEHLEDRFHAEMEVCGKREEGIQEEFNELLEVFKTWAATGSTHEEQRAGKRLRTRIAFVQQREKSLEEKRTHYVKVVKAFESALALLGGT